MSVSPLAERLCEKYFGDSEHPYRTFEVQVNELLRPESTLLDVGCGRTAPVLSKYAGRAGRLIGIDVIPFETQIPGIELHNGSITETSFPDRSVDLVMARSVMEHVAEPTQAFGEMYRILAPGGSFVFLTANLWDYASLIAKVVPNKWHPEIVQRVEGRAPEDVFPVEYKCNTKSSIRRFAAAAGFEISRLDYLGQYPAYFLFNGPLFLMATGYEKLITSIPALHFLRGWLMVVLRKPAR
jgi:ubiquinone/menaquinone biosynthesis C-methylase UbiE